MLRKKNGALACAIAGMGMLASTAASALTIDLAFTADNVVNSWWIVNQNDSTVVTGDVISTSNVGTGTGGANSANGWQVASLETVNDLAAGDYYVVFGATNNATSTGTNPAGFLAEISGADLAPSSQLLTTNAWKGALSNYSAVTTAQTVGDGFVPALPTLAAVQYESNDSDGGTWTIVDGIASNARWIWANLDGAPVPGSSAWLMAEITVVPIPAAGVLFVSAIAGLVVLGRRRLRAGQEALPA